MLTQPQPAPTASKKLPSKIGLFKDSLYVTPCVRSVLRVSNGVAIVTPSVTVLSCVTSYPLVVNPVKISDKASKKEGTTSACVEGGSHKLIAAGNEISSTT